MKETFLSRSERVGNLRGGRQICGGRNRGKLLPSEKNRRAVNRAKRRNPIPIEMNSRGNRSPKGFRVFGSLL
jgi:hypothetical protein